MASLEKKQYGLHEPLSDALPTPGQLAQDELMLAELKKRNNFESPEETQRRHDVLMKLHKITTEFIKRVCRRKGFGEKQLEAMGGKVSTYGSFRLGVFGPGSDIDTLIIAPKYVSREDWFEHFPGVLQELSEPTDIQDLKAVKQAYVPIIKLEYCGISIDLIFARLQLQTVPFKLDLRDDDLLRELDEVEIRCLNGTRVTDMILTLVPEEKTFRNTLRVIKLWANQRAIYGNIVGFPGGVAWAMMVAFVCQLYPKACASLLVTKFFNLMHNWPWPRPVQLRKPTDPPPGMNNKVWNPVQYPSDRSHLMPIITPAYPEMCSTHNITYSTRDVILRELKRGEDVTSEIMRSIRSWTDLFKKHTFFTVDFKYFLSVISGSKTKDAHLVWAGHVESRVRVLIGLIELSQPGIKIARPFVKGFERIHQCRSLEEIDEALQGSLRYMVKDSKSIGKETRKDATHGDAAETTENGTPEKAQTNGESQEHAGDGALVYTTTYYIGLELAKDSKSLDISQPVADFNRKCTSWPLYDPGFHSLKVIHTRCTDLPEDVFGEGEMKPTRAKKPKIVPQKPPPATSGVKRPASAVEGDLPEPDAKRTQPSVG